MRILPAALAAILFLGIAACGGASQPPAPATPAPSAQPVAVADPDALVRDAANLDGKPVKVSGFFLASDGKAQLCSLVLESYPPQCGGGAVAITGEVPADVMDALDSTSEPDLAQATWGWVEIVGTFAAAGDGGPTLAISSIRVAAP
jgi:hypothetical protein